MENLNKLQDPVPIAGDDILQIATTGVDEKPSIPTPVSTASVSSVTPLSFIRTMSERRVRLKMICKDDSSLGRRDVSTTVGWAPHKDYVTDPLSRPKSIAAQSIPSITLVSDPRDILVRDLNTFMAPLSSTSTAGLRAFANLLLREPLQP
ncbi:hypothetical protein FKM82_008910 [Ascaphus truei]